MGLGDRAYNLLRAYIGREWERIENVREVSARDELNSYLQGPKPSAPPSESNTTYTSRTYPTDQSDQTAKSDHNKQDEEKQKRETAYEILGLRSTATLEDLKRAYARLSERSLPAHFPEGSDERKKAAEIHLRVQESYDILLPLLDPRLRRFQSLDIE